MSNKISIIFISIILIILFCSFALPYYLNLPNISYGAPSTSWYEALLWIRQNTPVDARVLAWWDYGYWIEYIAEREAFVTPSQNEVRIQEVAIYFLSIDQLPIPGDSDYIIIDEASYKIFTHSMKYWAGFNKNYDITGSMIEKFFIMRMTGKIIDNYICIFDNGIKIIEYSKGKRF